MILHAELDRFVREWRIVGHDCGLSALQLADGERFIRSHWWRTRRAGTVAEYTAVVRAMLDSSAALARLA